MGLELAPDCREWLVSKKVVDQAAEEFRRDTTSYSALRKVQCFRLFRLTALPEVVGRVSAIVGTRSMILSARLKQLKTIVRKLDRFPNMRLSRMGDIVGLRIICESAEHARTISAALMEALEAARLRDYVETPADSGYRAYHVSSRVKHLFPLSADVAHFEIEIQVRSFFQHLWALTSESLGEQVKEGGGTYEQREYLIRLADAIRIWEDSNPDLQQTALPASSADLQVTLAKISSRDVRALDSFGTDWEQAVQHLLAWEGSLVTADAAAVLLFSLGSPKLLGYTHASILGMRNVPLPDWAPRMTRESEAA